MVIVVEGPSGSGKSTLIKDLSAHLHLPVYRAFREKMDDHSPGSTDAALKECGIPVNTWMEDLFAADFLATVRSGVILDRSMPSALAYDALGFGIIKGDLIEVIERRSQILELWAKRMRRAEAQMVYVTAPTEVCQARSGRFDVEHISREKSWIEHFMAASKLPFHWYNTDGDHPPRSTRFENLVMNLWGK